MRSIGFKNVILVDVAKLIKKIGCKKAKETAYVLFLSRTGASRKTLNCPKKGFENTFEGFLSAIRNLIVILIKLQKSNKDKKMI
jgi:hypothetical protein